MLFHYYICDVLGRIKDFQLGLKNNLKNNPSWFKYIFYNNIKVFQSRSFEEFGVMFVN